MSIQRHPEMAEAIAAVIVILVLVAIHIALAGRATADLSRDDPR